jgi:hypothetical protein
MLRYRPHLPVAVQQVQKIISQVVYFQGRSQGASSSHFQRVKQDTKMETDDKTHADHSQHHQKPNINQNAEEQAVNNKDFASQQAAAPQATRRRRVKPAHQRVKFAEQKAARKERREDVFAICAVGGLVGGAVGIGISILNLWWTVGPLDEFKTTTNKSFDKVDANFKEIGANFKEIGANFKEMGAKIDALSKPTFRFW